MFLDKFDLEVVAIDDKPCEQDKKMRFTFWFSGRIDRCEDVPQPTKEDILDLIGRIGAYYGVSPEEFGLATEKARKETQ